MTKVPSLVPKNKRVLQTLLLLFSKEIAHIYALIGNQISDDMAYR